MTKKSRIIVDKSCFPGRSNNRRASSCEANRVVRDLPYCALIFLSRNRIRAVSGYRSFGFRSLPTSAGLRSTPFSHADRQHVVGMEMKKRKERERERKRGMFGTCVPETTVGSDRDNLKHDSRFLHASELVGAPKLRSRFRTVITPPPEEHAREFHNTCMNAP